MFGFAVVAEDGVQKSGGSAVMHEARVQADTPERRGADLVGSIVEFGDGEAFPGGLVHPFAIVLQHGHGESGGASRGVVDGVGVGARVLVSGGGWRGRGVGTHVWAVGS